MNMKTIIIGIAGGTGSGKTTLTEKLRDHFGANEFSTTTATTSATTSCPTRSAASSTTTTRTALTRR